MSAGFHRQRPARAVVHPIETGPDNSGGYRQHAMRHLQAAIAYLERSEQCRPGCTNGAAILVRSALEEMTKAPSLWPPVVETKSRDEEE